MEAYLPVVDRTVISVILLVMVILKDFPSAIFGPLAEILTKLWLGAKTHHTMLHRNPQYGIGNMRTRSSSTDGDEKELAKSRQEPGEIEGKLSALRTQLAEKERELQSRDQRCTEQAKKIEMLQKNMANLEDDLNKSYNQTLDEMIKHTAVLDKLLKESKAENEELLAEARAAEEEKLVAEERVRTLELQLNSSSGVSNSDMETALDELKLQLSVKQAEVTKYEQQCRQQAAKIDALHKELGDLENHLNKSYNATLDELIKQIDHLGSALKQSNEQVVTLQGRVSRAEDNERTATAKVDALESQLGALNSRPAAAVQNVPMTTGASVAGFVKQISDLESRLTVANKMAEFLQGSLSRSEEEKRQQEAKASKLDTDLSSLKAKLAAAERQLHDKDFRLTETNRILKFTQDSLIKCREETKEHGLRTAEAEGKVAGLESQLKAKDNELYGKDFALQGTQRVLKFAQQSLEKAKQEKEQQKLQLEKEVCNREFKLTETNRVLKFVQSKLATTEEEKKANEMRMEKEICDMEFRLTESHRILKFLQSSCQTTKNQKDHVEAKAKDLETELTALRLDLANKQAAIRVGRVSAVEQAAKVQEMSQMVADLESRLSVTNRVAEFLKTTLSRAEEDKVGNEARIRALEAQLAEVKADLKQKDDALYKTEFQLQGTNRVLKFAQQNLEKTKEEKEQQKLRLEKEVCDREFRLTETNRVLKFMQSSLQKTQEEKKAKEAALEKEICEMKFRVTEGQRILKFLQSNLSKTTEQKKENEARAKELDTELVELKKDLATKTEALRIEQMASADRAAKMSVLAQQVADLESRLAVTNRVAEFLQTTLSRAEREKRVNEILARESAAELLSVKAELKAKDDELYKAQFQLQGTNRVLKFAHQNLEKTKEEKEQQKLRLEKEVCDREFRLTETNRVLKFMQSSLQKTQEEKKAKEAALEKEISEMKFRVTESSRILKFLQTTLTTTKEQKEQYESTAEELLAELNSLKAELQSKKDYITAGSEATIAQAARMKEMTKQVSEMDSSLSVTRSLADYLQKMLAKSEEEKRASVRKVDGLEAELGDYKAQLNAKDIEIEQLKFHLSESKRVAMFLQNKAAQSDAENRTNAAKAQELEAQLGALTNCLPVTKEVLGAPMRA